MESVLSTQLNLLAPDAKKIAVAISGGADSFALLHQTKKWTDENNVTLIALTVDHQLREESADEAKIVSSWCQQNNIEHHILNWQSKKPKTALQASARNARRRLLCDKSKQMNVDALLLGHQADDQAETMIMRLQRGTGLKGLKVIQPATRDKSTGIAILRPLLSVRRNQLREYCIHNDLPFIDDPSNDNPFFERVRIRQTLNALPALAKGIAMTAQRLSRADETLQKLTQIVFDDLVQYPVPQQSWLPVSTLIENFPEIRLRLLELAIQSSTSLRISLPQLERLNDAIIADNFTGMTLANCWVQPKIRNKQKGFLFRPAPPRQSTDK